MYLLRLFNPFGLGKKDQLALPMEKKVAEFRTNAFDIVDEPNWLQAKLDQSSNTWKIIRHIISLNTLNAAHSVDEMIVRKEIYADMLGYHDCLKRINDFEIAHQATGNRNVQVPDIACHLPYYREVVDKSVIFDIYGQIHFTVDGQIPEAGNFPLSEVNRIQGSKLISKISYQSGEFVANKGIFIAKVNISGITQEFNLFAMYKDLEKTSQSLSYKDWLEHPELQATSIKKESDIAAIAMSRQYQKYKDWFIPSFDILESMYELRNTGAFKGGLREKESAKEGYISLSDCDDLFSIIHFYNGERTTTDVHTRYKNFLVRPVFMEPA
jgi:hypothetical protein